VHAISAADDVAAEPGHAHKVGACNAGALRFDGRTISRRGASSMSSSALCRAPVSRPPPEIEIVTVGIMRRTDF
jgi:hypothetical protein